MVSEHLGARRIASFLAAVTMTTSVALASTAGLASASAEPCPDVEAIFARGTTEAPGVGGIGQAFIDSLQAQLAPKFVRTYAVDYPASTDFPTAAQGVIDAADHVRQIAATCPKTKMVLAGYSQGAAVVGYVTASAIPPGYALPPGITGPMPPEVADHVAAVALLGKPSSRFLDRIDVPPIAIGPLYAAKTIDQCIPDDPICSNDGGNIMAHGEYVANGMVDQAAQYAAAAVNRSSAPPAPSDAAVSNAATHLGPG
jgi:cutinase